MSDPYLGEIKMFGGNFAPRGWALCSGQLLPIAPYTALFSLLGTIYGGDGRTTFGLPDLRGRLPLHQGQGPELTPRGIGTQLGQDRVTLTATQMPSHTHQQQASSNPASAAFGPDSAPASSASTALYGSPPDVNMAAEAVAPVGGSQPHNNLAPFNTVNFIIALQGVYPSRA